MGVTTTADEKLNEAREHIKQAFVALAAVVVEECWGSDDYTKEYRDTIDDCFIRLRQIKKDLDR